jgi:hypothetical protein
MISLLCIALYIALGIATAGLATWFDPDAFTGYGTEVDAFFVALAMLGWPLALPVFVAKRIAIVTGNAKRKDLRVRAELEKELAAARREVEDLLRRGPVRG